MKLIYCATPSRLNFKKKEIMDFVTNEGFGPFHPFQAFEYDRFEGGILGRDKTMEFCMRAIQICDEFWLFGVSDGTLQELLFAQKLNKPVKLFLDVFDLDWRDVYKNIRNKYNNPLVGLISF